MKHNQGSAVIYIVLLMLLMMTSAAIVLSGVLSKHIRASDNYLSSERAFAGANSSIENMLYVLAQQGESSISGDVGKGEIEYGDSKAVYTGSGCIIDGAPHLSGSGEYRSLVRRIEIGGGTGDCPE
jgi:Tfp pilus assembly protein PilX